MQSFFISLHFQIIAFDIHLSIAVVVVVTEKCRGKNSILLQLLVNALSFCLLLLQVSGLFFWKNKIFWLLFAKYNRESDLFKPFYFFLAF